MNDFLLHPHRHLWIILIITLWDGVWKLIALWKAARLNKLAWFIVLGIINSAGILPIIYIIYEKREARRAKDAVATS